MRGLVLVRTRKINSDISPGPPSRRFYGEGQKVRNLASIFNSSRLWRDLILKQSNVLQARSQGRDEVIGYQNTPSAEVLW